MARHATVSTEEQGLDERCLRGNYNGTCPAQDFDAVNLRSIGCGIRGEGVHAGCRGCMHLPSVCANSGVVGSWWQFGLGEARIFLFGLGVARIFLFGLGVIEPFVRPWGPLEY